MTWRTASREERQVAVLWAVAAAGALALAPVWRVLVQFLPSCGFRDLTGLPCPTCGTTRAGLSLLHGDLAAAFLHNPAAAAAGLVFMAGGAAAALWALVRAPIPALPPARRTLRIVLVTALAANWLFLLLRALGEATGSVPPAG